jgi:hypothetical protein
MDAGLRLGPAQVKVDEARQEAGKRLTAAGRGDQQRVATLPRKVDELELMGMGAPAARGEPAGERLRQACHGLGLRPLFQRNHGNACLTLPFSFTNSGHRLTRSAILRSRIAGKRSENMERFFGGNPGLVMVRLAILSLVVGVLLAALGFSPFDILDSIRELIVRIYDLGWTAVEKAGRYFLLGAVIVFPVWFIARLLKMLGRGTRGDLMDINSRNREA